jgi:hypothetical protein
MKITRRRFLHGLGIALGSFLTTRCSSSYSASESRLQRLESEVRAEEYTVYNKVLQRYCSTLSEPVFIKDHAGIPNGMLVGGYDVSVLGEWISEGWMDEVIEERTFLDFWANNRTDEYPLNDSFDVGFDYELITKAEAESRWTNCDPSDLVSVNLSRVGFNRKMDQAFVYLEIVGCSLWGEGRFMLLSLREDGWFIQLDTFYWGA